MFITILIYKAPLEIIDQYLAEHRAYLEEGYKNNFFMASGPQNPRIGGIIISQLSNREQLEDILKNDPFNTYNVADYQTLEFDPVKYHPALATFIK